MKRKRIMAIIGVVLLMAVAITPITVSAASSEVVEISGTGAIRLPATDPDGGGQTGNGSDGTPSGGVGTVTKTSIPKTGDWSNAAINLIALLVSLVALLTMLLIKWHKEDIRNSNPQLHKS